jgi:hypothetical protein
MGAPACVAPQKSRAVMAGMRYNSGMMMRHRHAIFAGVLLAGLAQFSRADVMMPPPDWNADPAKAGVKARWDSLMFDRVSTNAVIPLAAPGLGYARRPDLWPLAYPEASWVLMLRDVEPSPADNGWETEQPPVFEGSRWLNQISSRGLMRGGGTVLQPLEVYRGLNEDTQKSTVTAAARVLFWLMPLLLVGLALFIHRRRFTAPR